MVKNEKFQCPSESWGLEDFKTHPTFVLSAIFGGVMASQNIGNFFLGHPVEQGTEAGENLFTMLLHYVFKMDTTKLNISCI